MAHKMPDWLSTEAVRGWSGSESGRRDTKEELLKQLDKREGVAGPKDSDEHEWHKCASHLLDLALDCMHTDYSAR